MESRDWGGSRQLEGIQEKNGSEAQGIKGTIKGKSEKWLSLSVIHVNNLRDA